MAEAAKIIPGVWLILSTIIVVVMAVGNIPLTAGSLTVLLLAILSLPFALPLVLLALVGVAGPAVIFFLALIEFAGGVGLIAWSD